MTSFAGAHINAKCKNRLSPLHWAAHHGDLKVSQLLLEKGEFQLWCTYVSIYIIMAYVGVSVWGKGGVIVAIEFYRMIWKLKNLQWYVYQRFWELNVFNTAQVNSLLIGVHHYHCRLGSAGTIVGIIRCKAECWPI